MPRTPQQIGASNRRAGKAWQLACAAWLRAHGYSAAEYVTRNGVNDLSGTGDVAVECTLAGWDQIYLKLGQAKRDAKYRGLDVACVWKKYVPKDGRGRSDPGFGAIVISPVDFWGLMRDLEAYRQAEMNAQDAYDRGYRAASAADSTKRKG